MILEVFYKVIYDKEKQKQIEGKEVKEIFQHRGDMEKWRKQSAIQAFIDYKTECEIIFYYIQK